MDIELRPDGLLPNPAEVTPCHDIVSHFAGGAAAGDDGTTEKAQPASARLRTLRILQVLMED